MTNTWSEPEAIAHLLQPLPVPHSQTLGPQEYGERLGAVFTAFGFGVKVDGDGGVEWDEGFQSEVDEPLLLTLEALFHKRFGHLREVDPNIGSSDGSDI